MGRTKRPRRSFTKEFKAEVVERAQVRRAVFEYVEVFYNRQRLHSALGYLSPAAYEAKIHHHHHHHAAEAA